MGSFNGRQRDGARGLAAIKSGGRLLWSRPSLSGMPEMPEAAIAGIRVDWILPLRNSASLVTTVRVSTREPIPPAIAGGTDKRRLSMNW